MQQMSQFGQNNMRAQQPQMQQMNGGNMQGMNIQFGGKTVQGLSQQNKAAPSKGTQQQELFNPQFNNGVVSNLQSQSPMSFTPNAQTTEDGSTTVETDYLYPAVSLLPLQHVVQDKVTVKHDIKVEQGNMIKLETPWGEQEVPLFGNFPSPEEELAPIAQRIGPEEPDPWETPEGGAMQQAGGSPPPKQAANAQPANIKLPSQLMLMDLFDEDEAEAEAEEELYTVYDDFDLDFDFPLIEPDMYAVRAMPIPARRFPAMRRGMHGRRPRFGGYRAIY